MVDCFINELRYLNNGAGTQAAFVEIACPVSVILQEATLVLYSGGGQYRELHLDDPGPQQTSIYVGEGGSLRFDGFELSSVQHGDPRGAGMALVEASGHVVQFLSYGGQVAATDGPAIGMTSVDIGVSQSDSAPAEQVRALSAAPH